MKYTLLSVIGPKPWMKIKLSLFCIDLVNTVSLKKTSHSSSIVLTVECRDPEKLVNNTRQLLGSVAAECDFQTITPDEILRDRLAFGISDSKIRERLL